jgi:hypothetical protein
MKGTANVPGIGGSKNVPTKPEDIGAQPKLEGIEGQLVSFDKEGNAVPVHPLTGTEDQYIGFDAEGKQVVKDLPKAEENPEGDQPAVPFATAFYGTIGTEWTEDETTGVKSQLVAGEGVLAAHHMGVVDVVMTHERTTEGYAAFVEETNQFLQFITNGDAETVDGGVMFYIYGDPNTIEIPFGMVVS